MKWFWSYVYRRLMRIQQVDVVANNKPIISDGGVGGNIIDYMDASFVVYVIQKGYILRSLSRSSPGRNSLASTSDDQMVEYVATPDDLRDRIVAIQTKQKMGA